MTTGTLQTETTECCDIELSGTVEDYLKAIFTITSLGEAATTSGIAGRLGVQPPTVSAMLRRLRSSGLVQQVGWGRVELTDHGQDHAFGVVRRHRLLETFLHRVLGIPWDEIHTDAEELEHHLSNRLEGLIDAALGFPERDPHGDPIPRQQGAHDEHGDTPLARTAPGDEFVVRRVYDSDSDALRHLAELGIRPGVVLSVARHASEVGPMWVRLGDQECLLNCALVNLIQGEVREAS